MMQKEAVARETHELRKVRDCLGTDLDQEVDGLSAQKQANCNLLSRGNDLRARLKAVKMESEEIEKYNMGLERLIEENDNSISAHKGSCEELTKKAITLETFTKAFQKNIAAKHKELSKAHSQERELMGCLASKQAEKGQQKKAREEIEWESRQYSHHNTDIRQSNQQL